MRSLVTRFHFLLLSVTVALTAVGYLRIPADFAFPAHWAGSGADWLWPRDLALAKPQEELTFRQLSFVYGVDELLVSF